MANDEPTGSMTAEKFRSSEMKKFGIVAAVAVLSVYMITSLQASPARIKDGSIVTLMYSLKANGQDVVTAMQREQIQMIIGRPSYPKALQDQLVGMKEGDKKIITLRPDQAFGALRPDLVRRVAKDKLPKNLNFTEGQLIKTKSGQGGMRVVKVLDDSVVFDQNHPLAGKTLVYNVQIANVD